MMIGVGFYSFTIGTLASVLSKIDTRSSQLKSKIEVIEVFCAEAKLSQEIKKRIKEALEYNSLRNVFSWIEKYSIFNELPPHLKSEVAMQIHDGAIGKLPFFCNKDATFIGNIVPLLQPIRYLESDYIYMKDDHPYDIYFLVKGRVNFVIDVGDCVFKQWPQGSYFGEIEIIYNKKRMCTAKAARDCDLFTLNKKYYSSIIVNDFPEIDKNIKEIALKREIKIKNNLHKAKKILEQVGLADHIALIKRASQLGLTGSAQSTIKKRYLKKITQASTILKIAQSFDIAQKRPSTQSSMVIGHRKLEIPILKKETKSLNDSASSSDYNIWEKNNSSENDISNKDKKYQLNNDSFQTDKSMKQKGLESTDQRKEENKGSPQFLKPLEKFSKKRPSLSNINITSTINPSKYLKDYQNSELQLVKEEQSLEVDSGMLRQIKNQRSKSNKTSQQSSPILSAEDNKDQNDISDIPKIKILQEPITQREHHEHQTFQKTHNSGNFLDLQPSNFQDSQFFSIHNESPSQDIFKSRMDQSYITVKVQSDFCNSGRQDKPIQIPKIMINDKTYNESKQYLSPDKLDKQELKEKNLEISEKVCNIEIIPQIKRKDVNIDVKINGINKKITQIQNELKENNTKNSQLENKVNQIISSIDLISQVVKDISNKEDQNLDCKNQQQDSQLNQRIQQSPFNISPTLSYQHRTEQELVDQNRRGRFQEDLEELQRDYGDCISRKNHPPHQ